MPKLNGYEAAKLIRGEPWGQDMVLVATTGWGQDEDRRRSKEAGFDHHMVKPIEPTKLQRLLAEMIPRRLSDRVSRQSQYSQAAAPEPTTSIDNFTTDFDSCATEPEARVTAALK
jgi:CheY-like chemotaxis protein